MKLGWLTIIGWAVAILFIFLYYRSCRPGHELSPAKGDSIAASALKQHLLDSLKAAGYEQVALLWKSKYDSLKNSYDQVKQKVYTSAQKIKELIDSNKYYKLSLDTVHQLTTCGDLITQDSILLELLKVAAGKIDSLALAHNKQIAAYDSTILALLTDNTQLGFTISDLRHEYDQAISEANKAIKKAKVSNLWTKVAAITFAIFGAVEYLTHK